MGNTAQSNLTSNNTSQVEFIGTTLEVAPSTDILRPEQLHTAVIAIITESYLTSASGKKLSLAGIIGPSNLELSNTQIRGENQKQYAAVMRLPVAIRGDQFKLSEQATAYLNDSILMKLNQMLEDVFMYKSITYNAVGITREILLEMLMWVNPHYNQYNIASTENSSEFQGNDPISEQPFNQTVTNDE